MSAIIILFSLLMSPDCVKVLVSAELCFASIYLQCQLTMVCCPIFFLAADLIGLTSHQYFTERRILMKSSCGYVLTSVIFLEQFNLSSLDSVFCYCVQSRKCLRDFAHSLYSYLSVVCASYLYMCWQREGGRPPIPRKKPLTDMETEPLVSDHPFVETVQSHI